MSGGIYVLVLTSDETARLLDMPLVLEALEPAYKDMGLNQAGHIPRADLLVPCTDRGTFHGLKTMSGSVPRYKVAAIRLNSDIVHWPDDGRGPRRVKIPAAGPGRWVGLVLLFDTETGEPLAIFPDGHLQRLRVAATAALAARYLARDHARVMGLYGSGWQAGAHILAMCAVRPIERVQVWSPNPANRQRFAAEMSSAGPGVEVVAVDRPDDVAAGADMVVCATNALHHVFTEEWLAPGMFLTCVRTHEFTPGVYARVDQLVLHAREAAPAHVVVGRQHHEIPELTHGWERPGYQDLDWAGAPLLCDLVTNRCRGRQRYDEITCFNNNIGIGLQFAAVGAQMIQRARQLGVGRELPTEWFLQDVHP